MALVLHGGGKVDEAMRVIFQARDVAQIIDVRWVLRIAFGSVSQKGKIGEIFKLAKFFGWLVIHDGIWRVEMGNSGGL